MKLIRYQQPQRADVDPLTALARQFDQLWDSPFNSVFRASEAMGDWAPALDIYEEKDSLVVLAELPGLDKESIEVSLENGLLSIFGERKTESESPEGARVLRTERTYGRFSRSVRLPINVDADKVNASYKDGILTVRLPKAEEAKPKQITID
ncbi:MAG: Hsp20/alpha crystallin family protein [Verrucomicrobiales bacterium]